MTEETSRAGNEFFRHTTRGDGTRDLLFGEIGARQHGHAVIGKNGRVEFIRESDGHVIADDRYQG